jgi:hypothetical protein
MRFGLTGGYSTRERSDYPEYGANDKTTRTYGELNFRYRPTKSLTANSTYRLTSTDNPFAPKNRMFEHYGADGEHALIPITTSRVYYYQKELNNFRYGSITNQASLAHRFNIKLNWAVNKNLKIIPALMINSGSNNDFDEFEFSQTFMQPSLGINYFSSDRVMLYANYSMIKQSQNGVAAVALMDG